MPSWELRYPLPLRYLKKSSFVFLPWKGGICDEVQALLESLNFMKFRYRAGKAAKDKSDVTWPVITAGRRTNGEVSPEIWRKISSAGWIKWSNGQFSPTNIAQASQITSVICTCLGFFEGNWNKYVHSLPDPNLQTHMLLKCIEGSS